MPSVNWRERWRRLLESTHIVRDLEALDELIQLDANAPREVRDITRDPRVLENGFARRLLLVTFVGLKRHGGEKHSI